MEINYVFTENYTPTTAARLFYELASSESCLKDTHSNYEVLLPNGTIYPVTITPILTNELDTAKVKWSIPIEDIDVLEEVEKIIVEKLSKVAAELTTSRIGNYIPDYHKLGEFRVDFAEKQIASTERLILPLRQQTSKVLLNGTSIEKETIETISTEFTNNYSILDAVKCFRESVFGKVSTKESIQNYEIDNGEKNFPINITIVSPVSNTNSVELSWSFDDYIGNRQLNRRVIRMFKHFASEVCTDFIDFETNANENCSKLSIIFNSKKIDSSSSNIIW
ncbi:MAG: hypothetical protein WCK31_03735 [bacterium]